jgi:hypothetical protein
MMATKRWCKNGKLPRATRAAYSPVQLRCNGGGGVGGATRDNQIHAKMLLSYLSFDSIQAILGLRTEDASAGDSRHPNDGPNAAEYIFLRGKRSWIFEQMQQPARTFAILSLLKFNISKQLKV